jgi:hypothetical protein
MPHIDVTKRTRMMEIHISTASTRWVHLDSVSYLHRSRIISLEPGRSLSFCISAEHFSTDIQDGDSTLPIAEDEAAARLSLCYQSESRFV